MYEISDAQLIELVRLAKEYASRRNLDAQAYIQGMFEPLARDGMALDLYSVCNNLTKYHREWLR